MAQHPRSNCPTNFALELFGDRWSLLILRDMIFLGKRNYQDFLESEEGISTNILADRLSTLEHSGIIRKERDPSNGRKLIYSPTEKGLDLVPVITEINLWSFKYDPKTGAPVELMKRIAKDKNAYFREVRKTFESL